MHLTTVLVAVATAVILLIQRTIMTIRASSRARNLGCRPANQRPHTHPLGFDLIAARMEAIKTGRRNISELELFEKYGSTYEEKVLFDRTIYTCDTANMQAIGATQFQHFGREQRPALNKLFGHGILHMNGPEWRHTRDLVTPLFQRAELSDVDRFKKYVDRMMDLIPRDGSTVDMQPLLQKLFLDSSTEFIFGESIDSLRDSTGMSAEFLKAFNMALAGAGKRMRTPSMFSFLDVFDKQYNEDCAKVHSFIDKGIANYYSQAIDNFENGKAPPSQGPYVLIDGMARVNKDHIKLRFQLLHIFFPARDTSAIAVSNALFFLARNPDLWQELRAQALKIKDKPLTFELLKSLQLFRYTVFEAVRLQGPSGQVRRIALRDTTLPHGGGPDESAPVFIPKGTKVYCNIFPGYRNKDLWGEDILEFRPNRFAGKLFTWNFTPFFGGPRICPASNMVLAQTVYVLLRLVTEFESIENRDPVWEYIEATRMLVESKNGVKIALHPSPA